MPNKLLSIAVTCCLGIWLPAVTTRGAERPNIVIILADDLGYADIGAHGCRDIPTPHIDALAASGVRCTSGYASHPFCSPTRAGLMTGRYQHRFGYVTNVAFDPQNPLIGLSRNETTIAERLQKAGYATGMAGKWHLGASHLHHPTRRGFDQFFGFLGGGHNYFHVDLRTAMGEGYYQPLDRNGHPEDLEQYLTDALTDHAVAFIEAHRQQPFFYYLAYNAPHTPMQAPDAVTEKFASIKDERRRTYAAMVHQMDVGIGRVLATLDQLQLRDNTLVFFFSDNGGPTEVNGSNNDPLRGNKGDVYEGGVRVPFIASWPAQLQAGQTYAQPVISVDISLTALAAGGGELPAQGDGVNLLPFLKNETTDAPHESLFWRKDDGIEWAVRSGPWKLVAFKHGTVKHLFDVATDIGETRNVIESQPGVVAELSEQYSAWNSQNQPPGFPGFREYHQQKNAFYEQLKFEGKSSVEPSGK